MNEVDRLVSAFRDRVRIPWQAQLSPQERYWFLVYPPELERRVRRSVDAFRREAEQAGKRWQAVDLVGQFPRWMASHDYRDDYFASPDLLNADAYNPLRDEVFGVVQKAIAQADDKTVTAVVGAASLFGYIHLSDVFAQSRLKVPGRLLVFFPGSHNEFSYRLLNARSTFTYQATPITASSGGTR